MLLRVNPKIGFWGFNSNDGSINLWFSFADPRPQRVNVDELPEEVAKAVRGAIRANILLPVTKTANSVLPTKTHRDLIHEEAVVLEKKAKSFLKHGVTTIKREVTLLEDISFLNALKIVEKNGKNRKTVLKLLEAQLGKVALETNDLTNLYTSAIVDEEEREIKIKKTPMGVYEVFDTTEDIEENTSIVDQEEETKDI